MMTPRRPNPRKWPTLPLLALLVLSGCYPQSSGGPQDAAVRKVSVVALGADSTAEPLSLVGVIEPWQEVVLSFEVPGVVAEVFVEEGHVVKPGAPIARLRLEDYELALSRAEAELNAARAKLALLRAGTRKEDLEAARADYSRATARADYWAKELRRAEELFRKNTIAAGQLQVVQREHDAADQEKRSAKAQLERAVAGPRKEEIDAAVAEVAAHTSASDLARRQLEKATLRAPFGGRVEARFLDVGATVQVLPTGVMPVVRLVDLSQVDAVVAVPEALLPRFADRPHVEIVSAVDGRIRADGEIAALGQTASRGSGTYELRARIANSDGRFTGGMVVTAKVAAQKSHAAIRVPLTALCRAYGQAPYVLLVEAGQSRVIARDVELGPLVGDQVEVVRGLSRGELLIVRGQDRVVAGDRVQYERIAPASVARIERMPP